jgi:hypothetical protein
MAAQYNTAPYNGKSEIKSNHAYAVELIIFLTGGSKAGYQRRAPFV